VFFEEGSVDCRKGDGEISKGKNFDAYLVRVVKCIGFKEARKNEK